MYKRQYILMSLEDLLANMVNLTLKFGVIFSAIYKDIQTAKIYVSGRGAPSR